MQVLPAESGFFESVQGQVVHHGLGGPDQSQECFAIIGVVEVQYDAAFVGIEIVEEARLIGVRR